MRRRNSSADTLLSQLTSQVTQRLSKIDGFTWAVIGVGTVAVCLCCIAMTLLTIYFFSTPAPTATSARPTLNLTAIVGSRTPPLPPTPTFNQALIGRFINPTQSGNFGDFTVLQIDVLNTANNSYERRAQLTSADAQFALFAESLNIAGEAITPLRDCPDHVRLVITRAEGTQLTMGVCLRDLVILRGVPETGGAELRMGPRFSDALQPYLPEEFLKLLRFG